MSIGGGMDLAREPRNGRNFEYAGEDPLLAGRMTGNLMRGVQSQKVMGDIKHYALNDQETGRDVLNVVLDKKSMRESDLLAFQIAIGIAQPAAVMCSLQQDRRRLRLRERLHAEPSVEEGLRLQGMGPLGLGGDAQLGEGRAERVGPGTARAITSERSLEDGDRRGTSAAVAAGRHGASDPAQHVCGGRGGRPAGGMRW